MRRILLPAVLVVLVLVAIVTPVAAASYSASLSVVEDGTEAHAMAGISVPANIDWMAENGFISTTGLDTRVETIGGAVHPHMLTPDALYTALPVPLSSQTNLYMTTGNADLDAFDIVLGDGGYFTVSDNAALELGDDFRIGLDDVYINTSVADVIADKPDALSWTTDGAGNMDVVIPGIYSDTPTVRESVTTVAGSVYSTATYWRAQTFTPSSNYYLSGFSQLVYRDGNPGAVTVALYETADGKPTGGALRSTTYDGDVITTDTSGEWITVNFAPKYLTAGTQYAIVVHASTVTSNVHYILRPTTSGSSYAGGAFVTSADSGASWNISDYDLTFKTLGINTLPALCTPLTSGHYDSIELIADGTNLNLDVDGVTVDTIAIGEASVPDNAAAWQFGSDATIYIGAVEVDVAGVNKATYAPTSIVLGDTYSTGTVTVTNGDATVTGSGTTWTDSMAGSVFVSTDGEYYVVDSITDTTHLELSETYGGGTLGSQSYDMYSCLQNETTADTYVGAITWGSTPTGITATLGSLQSASQPTPAASAGDTNPVDVLPAAQSELDGDIDTATLRSSLLYDVTMIGPLSTLSGFTEAQLWRLYAFMFVLLVTAGSALLVRSHLVLSGIACLGSMWYMYHLTIFPWWTLILSGIILLTTIIMERQPSI